MVHALQRLLSTAGCSVAQKYLSTVCCVNRVSQTRNSILNVAPAFLPDFVGSADPAGQ